MQKETTAKRRNQDCSLHPFVLGSAKCVCYMNRCLLNTSAPQAHACTKHKWTLTPKSNMESYTYSRSTHIYVCTYHYEPIHVCIIRFAYISFTRLNVACQAITSQCTFGTARLAHEIMLPHTCLHAAHGTQRINLRLTRSPPKAQWPIADAEFVLLARIFMYVYIYIHMNIYIYRERERERGRGRVSIECVHDPGGVESRKCCNHDRHVVFNLSQLPKVCSFTDLAHSRLAQRSHAPGHPTPFPLHRGLRTLPNGLCNKRWRTLVLLPNNEFLLFLTSRWTPEV